MIDPICPVCGAWTERIRTRPTRDINRVLRTYDCGNMHRFTALIQTTQEIIELRLVDKGKQGCIIKPVIPPYKS